ncbi:MAG: AAA family ATPase [Bacteroidales bacterium]|nr:AAA family ATPase [Bacteroidales bacterium]
MENTNIPIQQLTIKNYKSIIDTKIQLGSFNVLIGENGCGKSNILEAIALGAAASTDKLDFEYFANRGIRITEPTLMLPKFNQSPNDCIVLSALDTLNRTSSFKIKYDKEYKSHWKIERQSNIDSKLQQQKNKAKSIENLDSLIKAIYNEQQLYYITLSPKSENKFEIKELMPINNLANFLIYSLEESTLRKTDATNRIYPLGNHGEGLFAYLKEVAKNKNAYKFFNELKANLMVFDWFGDIEIPDKQLSNEYTIHLKDNYLDETLNLLDQRSTNEGFLYLLFYLTLIISDETPKFFAIENIDASFNPKLCREVIRRLIVLAKKHGKQIIATTHNPSVLDGLDLNDEDVRLYTIRRTIDGDTKASRVTLKEELAIPLSEAWQRGYFGGLPDNF